MTFDQQQRIAIATVEDIVAVAAGPGSGKTLVLTERARFISNTVPARDAEPCAQPRIVILTYTNAGAHEIRSRLDGMTIVEFVGTLHSWCLKLLQIYGHHIGYRPGAIAILAASDRDRVLLDVRDKLAVKVSDRVLLAGPSGVPTPETELIRKEYDFVLKRAGLVDYDRILKDAVHLLNFDAVRQGLGTIDHLLVDEAQDSAVIDWLIYSKIPATHRFYVGDPDQCCFQFRGAYPAGFVEISKHANVLVRLEINYRSDRHICLAANRLIAHNKVRVEKLSVPTSGQHGQVEAHGFENAFLELEDVAARIREERPSSIAVLCRINSEVKRCLDYLREAGIPVADRSERKLPEDWKRALLLVAIAINPNNDILVEQFLRLDLQAVHVNRLKLMCLASEQTLFHSSGRPVNLPTDTPDSLASYLASNRVSDATVGLVRERASLLATDSGLPDLLADLHAHSEAPAPSNDEGKVVVSTIHGAKGKEWNVVFLPAFEQGIIPHTIVTGGLNVIDFEEERRLAFVAVTRARHKVFLSYAERRKQQWGVAENAPSQFLAEMGL